MPVGGPAWAGLSCPRRAAMMPADLVLPLPEMPHVPDCFLPADSGEPAVPVHAVTATGLAGLSELVSPRAAEWAAAAGFAAASGETCLVPGADGAAAAVLFGLGEGREGPSLIAGRLPVSLPAGTYRLDSGFDDPVLASLAWALGAYRFTRYRRVAPAHRRLVLPAGVDAAELARIADGVALARDLVNTAPNDLGPAELADAARSLATRHGAVFSEIVGEALLADGFPLIHAVGAAAIPERAPRLIDISWGQADAPSLTLVGKGVCFDSGGLDIKPASGMLLMKKDMGGAANVLGLAHMIMDAKLPLRLRVLIPAVENAIAGAAFRPGDVFTARNGLTVEIGNTDAEGRLVLADALALASEDQPDLIVDLATLTGAARVALGPEVVPFYTRDDALAASLAAHGARQADPLWRMPLWAPYVAMLDSKIADINNAASGGHAGSITAALFLSRFVPEGQRWLHGDIFAWNPKAGTGPAGGRRGPGDPRPLCASRRGGPALQAVTVKPDQPARNAVVLAADARIFPAAVFAAERLAALNDRTDTDILVFTDSAADRDKAAALSLPFAVRPAVAPQGLRDAAFFLRFAILDGLARQYRRVLYLDVDIWVADARPFALFDLDMEGHAVAAVRDAVVAFIPGNSEREMTVGLHSTKYLNSGVLLVDGARYRADRIAARLDKIVRRAKTPFLHRDQSALNRLLRGDWLELSPCFNLLAAQWGTFVTRICPPAIVHFTGPSKPWQGPHFVYDHPARAAMERWFPGSAWKDFLPRFVDLSRVLDPSRAPRLGNFDMDFPGKPDFIRFLRETRFADETAGLSVLRRELLPPD